MDLYDLMKLLEESVARNGEKPLTNQWLLNMLKLLAKNQETDDWWYYGLEQEATNPNQ